MPIGADENEVQTDPGDFSARHQGLYARPAEAVIALRHDGVVAGKASASAAEGSAGASWSRCATEGAGAEAKRQFSSAFAPLPGEPKCATQIERFDVPRVPGAEAVEIRHKVHGDVFDNSTIVFTKGAFVYQVFASGAGIDDRRDELIDAAQALYERVPVDRPRS